MKFVSKYMKYINKNNILSGGAYNFVINDTFITKYGDRGIILKIASLDEFKLDLAYNRHYYVVTFYGGDTKLYNGAISVYDSLTGGYKYVIAEEDIRHDIESKPIIKYEPVITKDDFDISMPNYIAINKCNYLIGETVYFKDGVVRDKKNTTNLIRLNNLIGVITNIIQTPYSIPQYKCIYEIQFENGIHATEIFDEMIQKISNQQTNLQINPYNKNITLPMSPVKNINYDVSDADDDDKKIFNKIAKYYQTKIVQIIESDDKYKDIRDDVDYIDSKKGLKYILKLLKKFSKKNNIKWYTLKNDE